MSKAYKVGLCIVSLSLAAYTQSGAAGDPTFSKYHEPIAKIKAGAKPKLASSKDREFKTRIIEASRQRVNFAGHYVLSSFGCGSSCIMSFALDKNSGEVAWLPFSICCWGNINVDSEPISFRKDSRLVIVTGSRNEQGKGFYYYEIKNTKFVLVRENEL